MRKPAAPRARAQEMSWQPRSRQLWRVWQSLPNRSPRADRSGTPRRKKSTLYDGFTRMDESPSGSEVELRDRDKKQGNILVQREVDVRHHDEEWETDREMGLARPTVTASAYTRDGRQV